MNLQSIIILVIILAAVILAIRVYRKNGSCSCGCDNDCKNCSLQCDKKK